MPPPINETLIIKMQDGTQRGDENLCLSCRNGLHQRSARSGAERLVCLAAPPPHLLITEPIGRCSGYLDRTKPTIWDMQQIAWQLATDKGGRKIGFLSPEEWERRRGAPEAPPG